jgi:chaperonin GroEL (HSP60 family)
VADLLRAGAHSSQEGSWRESQRAAARWVEEFCAPGYGPHGGAKLIVAGSSQRWVRSAATALREAGVGPAIAPYADLAGRLHRLAGDQSTTAVLLCARLVRAALESDAPATPTWLQGYTLALRQARAWLSAHAEPRPAAQALSSVAPHGWADLLLPGLEVLRRDGPLDLATVDVRTEPDGPEWLEGVPMAGQDKPTRPGPVRVLLLSGGWSLRPRSEGAAARLTDPSFRLHSVEEERRRSAAAHVAGLEVGLLVAGGGLDEGLRGMLLDRGVCVWTDAPRGSLDRLARATGATLVARLEDTRKADLGDGAFVRRRRGDWLVRGAGPSATFVVPGESAPSRDEAVERGEALLRAAGLALERPGALPGGGRWQRGLASSLHAAADAAPGHAPLAMLAAAAGVAALADDLVRNAGRDAFAGGVVEERAAVWDGAAAVRMAVEGAFETALAVLRLDAAYARRPSAGVDLRGGTAPAGSRKGMPGDLPPLM